MKKKTLGNIVLFSTSVTMNLRLCLAPRPNGRQVQKAVSDAQRTGNRVVHATVETPRQGRQTYTKDLPELPQVLLSYTFDGGTGP